MSKVYFAGDHAFFPLKQVLVSYVESLGYGVEDMGPYQEDASDDYPDFVVPCAERVAREAESFAIVGGGSGQGEAMCANRVQGVRAVVFYGGDTQLVRLAREHNNANMLSLGARFATEAEAKEAVRIFLDTPFPRDERHVRRLAKF
jgi:ribose 5-phosphate isomerase B